MKRVGLIIISILSSALLFGQTPQSGFDFRQAEQALEKAMLLEINDPETQEQVCTIASMVGIYQFIDHRYEAAIRTLEYALSHSRTTDATLQIQNHVFLIHALCLMHDRRALARLRSLAPLLQELQSNTMRGDFPVEYADGMRGAMNSLLLPLTSLVSSTFPDDESLGYCFNLMLYLKQFAFYQLGNRTETDIRHHLYQDYRRTISARLKTEEVAIEFVPCMDIDERQVKSTNYVAYILNSDGKLSLVEVCNKKDVEALFQHNDSPWQLYAPQSSQLSSLVWNKLRPYVAGKRRIYLTPCGILNRVNFLLFNANVYELSSVCELLRTYRANTHSDALLIGDINYDQSITSSLRGDRDWGTLNGTKLEIESIAKTLSAHYAVTKLTGDAASEQVIRQQCNASPKILHFATHAICYLDSLRRSQYGYFDFPNNYYPERPELTYTGLVLSGGNLGFRRTGDRQLDNDGILLSEEISKLHLEGTALVVLSACNSANGIFDDIEGTFGLVQAFKLAGVKTIIASLSKVDDRATSEFMSHFYQRLSRGESLHTSFINAINHMKTRYPDQPKFWAMFKMIDCREP